MTTTTPGFNHHRLVRSVILIALIAILQPFANGGQSNLDSECGEFDRAVRATYDFRPALLSESQRNQKSAAMDRFWDMTKSQQRKLLPCLRKALNDPQANNWFRFDGSNLLVSLDPSESSKELQLRSYTAVNLDDVDLQVWVSTLARRGSEGFDTSDAGERWLSSSKASYILPLHGALQVDKFLGGIFIFGSMDETHATPALLRIAGTKAHPGRDVALSLLLMQATPEAVRGLKSIDRAGLPSEVEAAVRKQIANPKTLTKRKVPKTSREEFLTAFKSFINGDREPFARLVSAVPDGERDVVTVLKPEDVPLVRKVRRLMIANANQHAAEYYVTFTQILATMILETNTVN
jgi:hypothetical protein